MAVANPKFQPTVQPAAAQVGANGGRRNFVIALIVMIGALLLFFAPSVFSPEKVLFANDGPLGASMAKTIAPPQSMHGVWVDLSRIGVSGGTYVPNFTFFLFWILG